MENQREDLVVIFAGYKDRMDSFYESNPGLSSRVANHIDFPDYSAPELLQIAKMMLEVQQYRMTEEAETVLLEYVDKRKQLPLFANARTVGNAIDKARMRHANRMFASGDRILTKSDLVTILVNLKVVENQEEENFNNNQNEKFKELSKNKIGRNEPCPCNSGKKYKHCHGRL